MGWANVAAVDVAYDNATSGLAATDVQAALDEVAASGGGGGGGPTIGSGTLASLPTGAAGDLYLPTDAAYLYRKGASAWAAFGPIWQLTPPLLADLTWVNQSTATADNARGALRITMPAQGSVTNSLRLLVKATPAPPYVLIVGFDAHLARQNYLQAGPAWRDSASGKIQMFSARPYNSNDAAVTNWNSPSSVNGDQVAQNNFHARRRFVRLADDGTNRTIHLSDNPDPDLGTWELLFSFSRTTFLTPDQIGFCLNNASTAYGCGLTVYHWSGV